MDNLENPFCKIRGANPNAAVKGMHNVIAGSISGVMNSLAGSKKQIVDRVHIQCKIIGLGKESYHTKNVTYIIPSQYYITRLNDPQNPLTTLQARYPCR